MSRTGAIRRNRSQWAELIEQWRASGQSAREFCNAQGLGYASFCQWRRRLESAGAEPADSAPGFVDLSTLSGTGGRWDIVLSLGGGVELRLSRG